MGWLRHHLIQRHANLQTFAPSHKKTEIFGSVALSSRSKLRQDKHLAWSLPRDRRGPPQFSKWLWCKQLACLHAPYCAGFLFLLPSDPPGEYIVRVPHQASVGTTKQSGNLCRETVEELWLRLRRPSGSAYAAALFLRDFFLCRQGRDAIPDSCTTRSYFLPFVVYWTQTLRTHREIPEP